MLVAWGYGDGCGVAVDLFCDGVCELCDGVYGGGGGVELVVWFVDFVVDGVAEL